MNLSGWCIAGIVVGILAVILILSAIFYKRIFKRFYDIIFSGLAILILSPLLIILIIVGAINMKGNPFFSQYRPGKDGKLFRMIKFRSMSNRKDERGELLPDKDRLTEYGKFLRETSLDELPELFCIFIGKMSIIGPRPFLVRDMVFMSEEQNRRHTVKGGLTGLAQCSGRNAMSWEKKLDCDIKYIEKISFFFDIKILIMTVFAVFKREGINEVGQATAEDFGVYLLRTGKVSQEEFEEKMKLAEKILDGE